MSYITLDYAIETGTGKSDPMSVGNMIVKDVSIHERLISSKLLVWTREYKNEPVVERRSSVTADNPVAFILLCRRT